TRCANGCPTRTPSSTATWSRGDDMTNATDAAWDPVLRNLLDHMVKVEESDLYITAASPPVFRIDGVGYPAKSSLGAEQIAAMAQTLMTPAQREELERTREMNLALASSSGGRFRANLFFQRGAVGLVVRLVRTTIKTLADLKHPPALAEILASKR